MNDHNSQSQNEQTGNLQKPDFQWEAPRLYTEDWLKTLGGSNAFTTEDPIFHT